MRLWRFDFVTLYGNDGDESDDDISKRPFLDRGLSSWLVPKGLLQFASSNIYDPICFDNRSGNALGMPVVRVHHEDILCCRDTVHRRVVAKGFLDFLETLGEFVGDDRWSDE